MYYTVRGETLQDEPDYAGAAAALERAKGMLRSKVGAATGVRFTPTLAFVLDKVPETSAHMEELLARARAADADLARIRQGAKHAGDADPYRVMGAGGPRRSRWGDQRGAAGARTGRTLRTPVTATNRRLTPW